MGSNSSSGGGGRTDAGKNRTTAQKYTAPPSKAIGVDKFGNTITSRTSNSANIYGTDGNYKTINESGKTVGSSFISEGANKSNKDIDKMLPGGTKIIASIAKPLLAKGAKYNRRAFENLVIGNTKRGSNIRIDRAEWDAMSDAAKEATYSKHQTSRMQGKTDFYGREVRQEGGGSNNSNVVVQAPEVKAPASIEVSQAVPEVTSEEARDAANLLIKKRKGRGRSSTILTSAQGVQDNKGLTLGKPSLLG